MEERTFVQTHRAHEKAFTRRRHFTSSCVVVLLLQETVRSVQLHLHEFFERLNDRIGQPLLTASAWTQARAKLRHSAFIELNERAILQVIYPPGTDFEVRRWRGCRLLAIDSSLLRLPLEPAVGEEFGWVECENQAGGCGRYAQGRLSVLYDVLNRIAVETVLEPWTVGERLLAMKHLAQMEADDVSVLDRGYAGYEVWARAIQLGRHFICRCPGSSFAVVNELYELGRAGISRTVELRPSNGKVQQARQAGLPEKIKVRFVTVRLPTGQLEVLATSLLDEKRFPTECFGEAYGYRWGIETYYDVLKNRLGLENFTGRTVESVRQDVHATIFVSNLETVLTRPAQRQLEGRNAQRQYPAQVNRAVSFHAIKSHIIELLLGDRPTEEVVQQLKKFFLSNPVSTRSDRIVPRRKRSAWRSFWWQRTLKKAVF